MEGVTAFGLKQVTEQNNGADTGINEVYDPHKTHNFAYSGGK
jgi:hypothetical protein